MDYFANDGFGDPALQHAFCVCWTTSPSKQYRQFSIQRWPLHRHKLPNAEWRIDSEWQKALVGGKIEFFRFRRTESR